jgi:predicted transcriptional regulator
LSLGLLHYNVLSVSLVMDETGLNERRAKRLLSRLQKNAIVVARGNGEYAFTSDGKVLLMTVHISKRVSKPRQV